MTPLLPRPCPTPRGRRAGGVLSTPAAVLAGLALLGVVASCASVPSPGDAGPTFENPTGCPAHAAPVPVDSLDAPANPRRIQIPAVWPADETEIRLVVGADGRVDPETVTAAGVGDRRALGEIRSAVAGWTFTPARRGPCWVASEYRYTIRSREP